MNNSATVPLPLFSCDQRLESGDAANCCLVALLSPRVYSRRSRIWHLYQEGLVVLVAASCAIDRQASSYAESIYRKERKEAFSALSHSVRLSLAFPSISPCPPDAPHAPCFHPRVHHVLIRTRGRGQGR